MTPARTDFFFLHVLLIPGGLALAALLAETSGLDLALSSWFFDPALGGFPAHAWAVLELFGHRLGKSLVFVIWFALLVAAVMARYAPALARHARVLWAAVLGMAFGPVLVVLLKGVNSHHCPWDLKIYGGAADLSAHWFVTTAEVGHCFPSGHASAGFSLVALMFAGRYLGHAGMEKIGLWGTLLAGVGFSLVRIAQGAHFLSHNLWSAAICWCLAALPFALLPLRERQTRFTEVRA